MFYITNKYNIYFYNIGKKLIYVKIVNIVKNMKNIYTYNYSVNSHEYNSDLSESNDFQDSLAEGISILAELTRNDIERIDSNYFTITEATR